MSDEIEPLSPLPFVCPLCLWSWASEGAMRAHIPATHNTTLDRFDAVMEEPTNAINYHVGVNERLTDEVERLTLERDEARAIADQLNSVSALLSSERDAWNDAAGDLTARLHASDAERDALAAKVAALREALKLAGTDLIGFLGYFERIGSNGTVQSVQRTIDVIDAALAEGA
jgi:chromosome segregation ATPase